MFPYKTSIFFDRKNKHSLYLQLSKQIIDLIKENRLPTQTKLPSSRSLSELLGVHRKTIVACYEELMLQGWIETIPKKGTFVHHNLPDYSSKIINDTKRVLQKKLDFIFIKMKFLEVNKPRKRVDTYGS